ncbi:hypothetical protein [Pengzhenrongella frigida]|uniref:Uncharacterized protein n=1 Tax=Pengzhenrongella frigida TaxID=1259133 RepID=A0A4Q5MW43_9MICO|nr:hypothetical protein [Cellulomonas sp. HLT2-17]RYV49798.1 hypothetical protein EUA98_16875 [Cellulomonas sp. HLT2-17]
MDQESAAASGPDQYILATTRGRLHGIAECLLAGPQRRAGGGLALRVTPSGFATTGEPALRLDGTDLVLDESRRVAVGGTFGDLAELLGVEFGAPAGEYPDGSNEGSADDASLDPASARLIEAWFRLADAALRVMAPEVNPILWPEHFDVAILLDDTSYGASAGDSFHATPYAYVSSGQHGDSEFWNAPFGALRDYTQMGSIAELVAFWRAGQALLTARG